MNLLYHLKRFQDTVQINSPSVVSSDKSESIFLPVTGTRGHGSSPERGSGKGTGFYSRLFLIPKKNGKLHPVIDLSLLNQYIRKQPFKMETVKSVCQSILPHDWTVSIDLTDAYLHVPIHPRSRKCLRFLLKGQVFQFTALPICMALSPWICTKLLEVIASHMR